MQKHYGISVKQLSSKYKVAARTIYRDIDVINQAGILIYSECGKYYIKENIY